MADPWKSKLPPLPSAVPILDALPADAPRGPILDALPAPPPLPPPLPVARAVPPPLPVDRPKGPLGFAWRVVRGVGSAMGWLFGAAVLTVGLAALAALPVLQFLSLGYLLESGARVARSGRL